MADVAIDLFVSAVFVSAVMLHMTSLLLRTLSVANYALGKYFCLVNLSESGASVVVSSDWFTT